MLRTNTLYRIVSYKKGKNDLKLHHISYSQILNYGMSTTGISPKEPLNNYQIKIDKNSGMLDKNRKLIFENDLIENENHEQYIIEWCQDKLGFVLRNSNPENTLESLDITNQKWKLIGNKYEDVRKYKKITGE